MLISETSNYAVVRMSSPVRYGSEHGPLRDAMLQIIDFIKRLKFRKTDLNKCKSDLRCLL